MTYNPEDAGTPTAESQSLVLDPASTRSRRRIWILAGGFVAALAAMLVVGFLVDELHEQEAIWLDQVANPLLHAISSPALDSVMTGITNLASVPVVAAVLIVACAVLLSAGRRNDALLLLVAIAGSVALNEILKVLIARPRPALPWADVLPDYSFPSGHTMNSFVLYMTLALIVWRWKGRRLGSVAVALALVIAVSVGFSRIYLGYHYFSDVVGGLAAGLAWLVVIGISFEVIPRTSARRSQGRAAPP